MNILNRGIAALLFAALTLIGCGGGGDSGGGGSTNVTGKFIDAPVSGMNYRCGTATTTSGTTTADGSYTCPAGQKVSFYIGDIQVGFIAQAQAITTPLDLAVGANVSPATPQVQNIVQFLMSISSTDPTVANGVITIPASVHTAAIGKTLDFATTTAVNLSGVISAIQPTGAIAYTALQAKDHMTKSLNAVFAGNYSGTYSGAASGNWSLTIAANGTVTGTSDAGAITGSMATTLSTGSTYAFTGDAGGVTWNGTLNVSTKVFSGTWNDGAGSSGTFTGTASTPGAGGGNFVTTCIANSFSHGVTAAQLTPFVRSYTGNLYAQPASPTAPLGAPGAAVNLAIAANGGITYNGAVQPVSSLCMDNTNSAQIYVMFASGALHSLDFFTDGGVTGNLNDGNFTIVKGGSCNTTCGSGGGSTTTPTVTGFSPATGAVGTTVTITGTNLGLGFPPAPIVKFGTTAVTTPLTFSGQTSISFAVPAGLAVGAYPITIGGATGTPMTVGTFTVTAAGGGATGLTFTPAWRGFSSIPNSPVNQLVTGLGAGLVYDDPLALSRFAINLAYVGANAVIDLQIADLSNGQSALGGGCGLTSALGPYPTCASMGISFNRTTGNVSFFNASIGGSTINGTLTFAPF